MILSDEPGHYVAGSHGIRTENLLVVEPAPAPADGTRKLLRFGTLTLAPIDRRLIVPELLSTEEREWLDLYHARVLGEIAPLVDKPTGQWLAQACAPLVA